VIVIDMHKVLLLNLNVFVGSASVCKACILVITLGFTYASEVATPLASPDYSFGMSVVDLRSQSNC